ncbi:preprotein translocase subunit SecE [Humisphaera borealis]|uniref:Protein translocase subunit SecE n=1 Tax=Humisphaera borealis TaxID=2807512 RepID=A0A7M2WUK3_9BACT|nr:preprotein translocase subunit SecE [Humisphaera borealis]QOV89205.1 preprotein translocase subunit SecE [Humisphaera borealis]
MASVMKDNEDDTDATEGPDESAQSSKGKKPEKDDVRALDVAREKSPRTGSYFAIYKKGQGYWTRMGTLLGVLIVGLMLCYTLYAEIPRFFAAQSSAEVKLDDEIRKLQGELTTLELSGDAKPTDIKARQEVIANKQTSLVETRNSRTQLGTRWAIGIAVGFGVIFFGIAIRLMNKPDNVDFLIATDSEMKKVNWTSRKELVGSSKVVILFMFFIAAYLFLNDLFFGWLMWVIDVLKFPPPPFK